MKKSVSWLSAPLLSTERHFPVKSQYPDSPLAARQNPPGGSMLDRLAARGFDDFVATLQVPLELPGLQQRLQVS